MTKSSIIILILIFALGVLGKFYWDTKAELEEKDEIQLDLKDSISFYKNERGESIGRISTLQASNTSALLDLTVKDKTLNKLQGLVSDYEKELKKQGSAGVITIEGETKVVTETIIDTVTGDYNSEFNLDNWVWGKISASKDSTDIQVNIREEVSFVIGKERGGFLGLGKPKYFSDVKLANPYNEVTDFRTYDTKVPVTHWHLTAGISSIYNLSTGEIVIGPGLTLGYTFLRW